MILHYIMHEDTKEGEGEGPWGKQEGEGRKRKEREGRKEGPVGTHLNEN